MSTTCPAAPKPQSRPPAALPVRTTGERASAAPGQLPAFLRDAVRRPGSRRARRKPSVRPAADVAPHGDGDGRPSPGGRGCGALVPSAPANLAISPWGRRLDVSPEVDPRRPGAEHGGRACRRVLTAATVPPGPHGHRHGVGTYGTACPAAGHREGPARPLRPVEAPSPAVRTAAAARCSGRGQRAPQQGAPGRTRCAPRRGSPGPGPPTPGGSRRPGCAGTAPPRTRRCASQRTQDGSPQVWLTAASRGSGPCTAS